MIIHRKLRVIDERRKKEETNELVYLIFAVTREKNCVLAALLKIYEVSKRHWIFCSES